MNSMLRDLLVWLELESEWRKHERLPASDFCQLQFEGRELRAKMVDLCDGGVGIVSDWPMAVGASVIIASVDGPRNGLVVHCFPQGSVFRIGIQFLQAEAEKDSSPRAPDSSRRSNC